MVHQIPTRIEKYKSRAIKLNHEFNFEIQTNKQTKKISIKKLFNKFFIDLLKAKYEVS